jgi:oligosaccharide repeat unit polymerase
MVLAWVIMPLMAFSLYESAMASGGWAEIGSLDFRIAYSHGVGAHAVVLAFPLVIFLMGTYRKGRRLQLLTVSGLLLFLFASQVKGTLLAPFIGAIVFRVARGNLNLSVKKLGAAAGITYLMFNGVYLLGYSFADSSVLTESEVYPELGRHYLYYLWSGILALSEAIKHGVGYVGGPWYEIFSPFINLYREMFGAGHLVGAGSAHELGMETDLLSTVFQGVNVYTMFGTLYLYLGALGGICVVLVLSALFYGLLLSCRTTENVWLLTLYCALVSWLVLGFFEYYFMSLTFIEVAFYCLILRLVSGRNRRICSPGISDSLNLRSSSIEPL